MMELFARKVFCAARRLATTEWNRPAWEWLSAIMTSMGTWISSKLISRTMRTSFITMTVRQISRTQRPRRGWGWKLDTCAGAMELKIWIMTAILTYSWLPAMSIRKLNADFLNTPTIPHVQFSAI